MEYLGLYDKYGNALNKNIERGNKDIPDNEFIRIVTLWIKNDKGQYLIQRAGGNKKSEWATTGGHVQSHQTSLLAVQEEAKEELGIILQPDKLEYVGLEILNHAIFDVYTTQENFNISDFTLQAEEVELVTWKSISEINQLIHDGTFRKSHTLLFQKFILK